MGKRLSFREVVTIHSAYSTSDVTNFKALTSTIVVFSLAIEAIGAVLLFIETRTPSVPALTTFGAAIFHSVSAFCNAGLGLRDSNFIGYKGDMGVNLIITTLIIVGGIGFVVLMDLYYSVICRRKKLSLNSKVAIVTTVILIFTGALLIFVFEYQHLGHYDLATKILISYFQSVTTRTAGFCTINIGTLSNATLLVMMVLMFIGASPASCGGGIKTTTFAVLIAFVKARLYDLKHVTLFYRTVPHDVVSRALSLFFIAATFTVIATLIMTQTEMSYLSGGDGLLKLSFEAISAIGTVGLSTGITEKLTVAGKFVIIFMMYIGRVGPLTLAMIVARRNIKGDYRYIKEEVLIG